MDIRTVNRSREAPEEGVHVPPDRSAYLRRMSTHRLRKRQLASRRLIDTLKLAVRFAAAAAAVIVLVTGYRYAVSSARFELRTVRCEGCVRISIEQLEEIIRNNFPKNILQIDLRRLRDRLQKERWIRKVEIRRVLPGGLIIYVEERTPAAIAELNGVLLVTDPEGILLDKYTAAYQKMDAPVLSGLVGKSPEDYIRHLEENSSRIGLGLQVLSELQAASPDYLRQISEVDLSDPENIRILLVDDTAEVYLGDRDFLKRFRTFVANMAKYQELKAQYEDIASVDLRYDGKIIYRPRNLSATPVETAPRRQP